VAVGDNRAIDLNTLVLHETTWKTLLGYLYGLISYLVLAIVSVRPKVALLILTALIILSWIALDVDQFPWRPVERLFTSLNLHVLRPELNAIREVSHLPRRVREYQKITLVADTAGTPVKVHKACTVERGGELLIRGPLTLLMDSDVGITCYGKLTVHGADKNIVLIKPSSTNHGWRNIELLGEGANGSKFSHCALMGGTGTLYRVPNINVSSAADHYQQQPLQRIGSADDETTLVKLGGAVVLSDVSNVDFVDCIFEKNSARSGGALALYSVNDARFLKCSFIENAVSGKTLSPGGAMYCANSDITVRDCRFERNRALDKYSCGGAVYAGFHCTIQFWQSIFKENVSRYVGGGVYALSLLPTFKEPGKEAILPPEISTMKMIECTFDSNHSSSFMLGSDKGGCDLYIDGGYSAELIKCNFFNSATTQPLLIVEGSKQSGREVRASMTMRESTFVSSAVAPYRAGAIAKADVDEASLTREQSAYKRPKGIMGCIDDLIVADCFKKGRMPGSIIDTIVIHHTSAINWDKTDDQLTDSFRELFRRKHPELAGLKAQERTFNPTFCKAIFEAYKVSAHYLIDREGYINRLVREQDTAWHAGRSRMPDGRENANSFSIGVELISTHPDDDPLVRKGTIPGYTADQYDALLDLVSSIRTRHSIKVIVGHDEIAPGRRRDPGPLFDWTRVRRPDRGPL